jgi:hypothetical protein
VRVSLSKPLVDDNDPDSFVAELKTEEQRKRFGRYVIDTYTLVGNVYVKYGLTQISFARVEDNEVTFLVYLIRYNELVTSTLCWQTKAIYLKPGKLFPWKWFLIHFFPKYKNLISDDTYTTEGVGFWSSLTKYLIGKGKHVYGINLRTNLWFKSSNTEMFEQGLFGSTLQHKNLLILIRDSVINPTALSSVVGYTAAASRTLSSLESASGKDSKLLVLKNDNSVR